MRNKSLRMDAGYWIKKKGEWQKDGKKLKKAPSPKLQAASALKRTQLKSRIKT